MTPSAIGLDECNKYNKEQSEFFSEYGDDDLFTHGIEYGYDSAIAEIWYLANYYNDRLHNGKKLYDSFIFIMLAARFRKPKETILNACIRRGINPELLPTKSVDDVLETSLSNFYQFND